MIHMMLLCVMRKVNKEASSLCSLTCAGVAVPSAVERKELQQFPVVKEVPSKLSLVALYLSLNTFSMLTLYRTCHPSSPSYLVMLSS